MIFLAFTLSGLALLALQVSTMDLILWLKRLSQEFDQDLGHDSLVFPDFVPVSVQIGPLPSLDNGPIIFSLPSWSR